MAAILLRNYTFHSNIYIQEFFIAGLDRILGISIFLAIYKSRVSSQMEVACTVGKSGSFFGNLLLQHVLYT